MELDLPILVLKAAPRAAREARAFACLTLDSLGFGEMADHAALVVSELATNAIRHGSEPGDPVVLRIIPGPDAIRLEVWDRGTGLPAPAPDDPTAESGRGLPLIEALTTRWGVRLLPDGGKIVYADLPCSS